MTQKYTKLNVKTQKTILFLIGLFTLNISQAQSFLGLQQSNYGGIHQSALNPANIAGSRHKFYANAFTLGLGFNNDYLQLNMPFSVIKLVTGNVPDQYHVDGNPDNRVEFQDAWFEENLNGKSKNMNIYNKLKMPGFMVTLKKGFAVGLRYTNTTSFQINDMAEPMAQLIRYGIDSSSGNILYSGPNTYDLGQGFNDNAFTINANMWGEWAGTVAKTLIEKDNMVLKVGFTGKYLMGNGNAYIKNNGVQFKLYGEDSLQFGETDVEIGYSNSDILNSYDAINADLMFKKPDGAGFGYDLGATIEWKPEGSKKITNAYTNYLFRAGLSILDAGSIKYKKTVKTTHITSKPGSTVNIGPEFFKSMFTGESSSLEYSDSAMRANFNIDTSQKEIKTKMPTTINAQFDYNIFKNFYIAANLSQDLRGKDKVGIRNPSYLMLIPRFESKFIEFSLPVGIMDDYKKAKIGVYLRIGPLFVGSDNLIGQLQANRFYGGDVYFGLSMGILNKKERAKKSEG